MGGANAVPSPNINHFSHPHVLELSSFQYQEGLTNPSTLCSCCKLTPSGQLYICRPCNFILHLSCSQFPQIITHSAHDNNTLNLLPISPYASGKFCCDACERLGNGFSYHCSVCRYDLHPICAFKPPKFIHQFHACPLALTFKDPYTAKNCFSCNICGKSIGSNEWRYRCSKCDFDVHLGCTKASPARGVGGSGTSNIPPRPGTSNVPPRPGTSNIPHGPAGLMNDMAQECIQAVVRQIGSSLASVTFLHSGINSRYGHYDHHYRIVDQDDSNWDGDHTGGFIGHNYHLVTVDQGDSNWDGDHTGRFIGHNYHQGTVDQGDSNWDGDHTGRYIGHNYYQGTVDQGDSNWDGDHTGGFIGHNYHQGTVDQGDSNWDGDYTGGFTDDFYDF